MATETHHSNDDSLNQKETMNYMLDERRRAALTDVDNAAFSWFHVKVATVAGVGFFTDA
jgi:PHS family inorganic phosphate transporter-like MFS transporter